MLTCRSRAPSLPFVLDPPRLFAYRSFVRLWFARIAGSAGSQMLLIAVGFIAWVVVSLRNDDSTASIVARNLVRKMGLAGDSTTFDAIGRMSKCEKQGRLDDAIQAGISWTQQHPNDGSNDLVFKRIATVFLGKAQRDGRHAEGYVKEALVYRDKALPLDSDPSRGGAAWLACETWLLSLSPLVISQTSSDACNTETRISCFKKSFFA